MRQSLFSNPDENNLLSSQRLQAALKTKIARLESSQTSINEQLETNNNILKNLSIKLNRRLFTFEAFNVTYDISFFKERVEALEKDRDEGLAALKEAKAKLAVASQQVEKSKKAKLIESEDTANCEKAPALTVSS